MKHSTFQYETLDVPRQCSTWNAPFRHPGHPGHPAFPPSRPLGSRVHPVIPRDRESQVGDGMGWVARGLVGGGLAGRGRGRQRGGGGGGGGGGGLA